MGLAAAGVMGIKPGERDDRVVGMDVVTPKGEVFLITDQGLGKRTPVKEFPTQGRYGMGVTGSSLVGKQKLVGMLVAGPDDRLTVVTSKGGGKLLKIDAAGRRGRAARGSTVLKLKGGDVVERVVPMLAAFSLPEREAPSTPKGKAGKGGAVRDAANKVAKPKSKPAKKSGRKK
jgi:DNA gyrase subunit A